MKYLILAFLFVGLSLRAQTFTEFYAQTTGDNLNSGSTTNDAANTTYAGGTWNSATFTFTVASGNPTSDTGVTNGAWASIYTTAGATVATCVGMITNTSASTIVIDGRTVSGSVANPSGTAAATTCKVGGAWKGPNGTVGFPFGFLLNNSTNGTAVFPRCNLRAGTYSITAGMAHNLNGPITFEGMTSVPGDGGKATFDGGNGSPFVPLSMTANYIRVRNLIFQNNGSSGTAGYQGIAALGFIWIERCVFNNLRGPGIIFNSINVIAVECEAYRCDLANSATSGGFEMSAAGTCIRCISHANSGNNASGFYVSAGPARLLHCIAFNNGKEGIKMDGNAMIDVIGCDVYNNAGAGVDFTSSGEAFLNIQNSNFIKNGGYGINSSGAALRTGRIANCGFGAGTQTNSSGSTGINLGNVYSISPVTYASDVTPWSDPTHGVFNITLASAKSAGIGYFTQNTNLVGVTTGYPDIGAAQASDTNATATTGGNYTFAQ